ncbi:FKBP-type peptidyl-prolyl cis-trans isomerase [Citricoccus sp. I39-566]|uniref:FKBP-type peptidyl-prolyl cis-trans isomerase n=1 Tax=Citricoccus sp. I39-566 TaxID=3073268 RepID=UPI00286B52DF|nr:FKBP-type peptidyl-prolyl cis-trans isomerase [Citricoccus sp. I39-566]WMY77371.1 FKBP-type peptidyl-prolyl cis-trans isomerase [Citricoccus sp. I39-566]
MSRTPSRSRRFRAAAPLSLSLVGALLLAGCAAPEPRGAGDVEALEPVSLSLTEDGAPEVTVDGTIEATEISSRVLKDGDGEEVNEGDLALVQTAIVDPESGEVTAENFTQGAEAVFLNETLKEGNDVLYDMLDQNKVGAQISFFMPASQLGQGATDQLMVFQIADSRPARAEGEPVEVTDESLPAVTLDEESGEPTIAAPEGDAPEDLVVQPLIQGDGEEVGEGDYVTIHYKGVKWSDGEEFDSSWSKGAPAGFQLASLISGWSEGLQGQKVGSQVLLVVPPAQGYGESDGHELQEETLVFVVDILHTMPPAQPAPAPQPEGEGDAEEAPASPSASPSASE